MIKVSNKVSVAEHELQWQFVRAQGPGGQHVNKTSSAAVLIFDINASSLPDYYKQRLLALSDHRISAAGKVIIKSQGSRSQFDNRQTALTQLTELLKSVTVVQKKRIATKPTKASQRRRVDSKKRRAQTKASRAKPLI
ncbi:alternative ribosome rescue aminoacyl-tRNA hydrolase ArfB [Paraferrimonas sedimenticola]|uniref:Peptidyl-tRNA hydrolase n=1 Tax=Paraferrimonas sedimenticola TaxID=375674 RepID=A0AA37RYM4_9GAMM|nr:alternative ribosome rescue aminoacyl-tRNA hydrolase ArfB [Paraferrimonas sedimenticola]GLP97364.1 peptidyl-tRNA hydrolase [Paraferrimonas sedimenticola]